MLHFQFPGAESLVEGGVSKLATVCTRSGGSPLRLCVVCVGFRLTDDGENRHRRTESHHGSVGAGLGNLMGPLGHPQCAQDSAALQSINWPYPFHHENGTCQVACGTPKSPGCAVAILPEPVCASRQNQRTVSQNCVECFGFRHQVGRMVFRREIASPRCIGMSQYPRNRRTCHGSRCPGKDTNSL
jgi:hypothetical protein